MGALIRLNYALNSLVRQGRRCCCADREAQAVHCLSATVSTALGWATQLAVCSGQASWVRGRAAVFSSGWGYKLVPLPRWSGRTRSKTGKALRGLDSSRPVSQVSWLNRAAGSARQSSAPAGLGSRAPAGVGGAALPALRPPSWAGGPQSSTRRWAGL